MTILKIEELSKNFPNQELFSNVNFEITDTDRIAIVGKNGTGKSTILKCIIDEIDDYDGMITLSKGKTIGYLSQKVIEDENNTLLDEMKAAFKDITNLEIKKNALLVKMETDTSEKLLKDYSLLENKFLALGGYDYHYKIDAILNKLGFSSDLYKRVITSFSGGERTKIALAKLLLKSPDLIILDEPTNHLDLKAIDWLESYLKACKSAILIVSHDIEMINNLCNKIYALSNKEGHMYHGNYEKYLKDSKSRYDKTLARYKKQQQEIAKMDSFISKNIKRSSKIGMVRDRLKKLEKMDKIDKPVSEKSNINFNFNTETKGQGKFIELKGVNIGYDQPLIEDVSLSIFNQDKIAIIGDNGSGKSTLIKSILYNENILKGKVKYTRDISVGYFDQDHLNLKEDATIFDFFNEEYTALTMDTIRKYLGGFDFFKDDVFKKINSLSGGEKVRLIFANLMMHDYDILLLDEPTNHLDYSTRLTLIKALKEYKGCVITVSHDRYFINSIANVVIEIDNKEASLYHGNYTYYKYQKENSQNKYSTLEKTILVMEDKIARKQKELKKYKSSPKKTNIQKTITELKKELEKLYNEI